MSKLMLIVVADENDADYLTEMTEITERQVELLKPIVEAIKNFKPYKTKAPDSKFDVEWTHHHNWPNGDPEAEIGVPRTDLGEKTIEQIYECVLTPAQISWFNEFVPHSEYGIHTIQTIKLQKIEEETELYQHRY